MKTGGFSSLNIFVLQGINIFVFLIVTISIIYVNREVSFPWHASIFLRQRSRVAYICGGSLISRSFVLTAAHCVVGHIPKMVYVHLGTETVSNLIRIHVYPLYFGKAGNYGSDIALLELPVSVRYENFIYAVKINWQPEDFYANLKTMGFVPTKTDDLMKIVSMPVVGYGECLARQRKDFWKFITFTSFCAGWADGARGVCNGDSGSGLVVYSTRRDKWLLKVMRNIFQKHTI